MDNEIKINKDRLRCAYIKLCDEVKEFRELFGTALFFEEPSMPIPLPNKLLTAEIVEIGDTLFNIVIRYNGEFAVTLATDGAEIQKHEWHGCKLKFPYSIENERHYFQLTRER